MTRSKRLYRLVSLTLIIGALVLAACQPEEPVSIREIVVTPNTAPTNGKIVLSATVNNAAKFEWWASEGIIEEPTQASTRYTAPTNPATVTIRLTVWSSTGSSTTQSTILAVIGPSPTPIPTATPPPPTATITPVPPTPLPATATPIAVLPLEELFPQAAAEGQVDAFLNPPGTLGHEFTEAEDCRHTAPFGLRLTFSFEGVGNGGWLVKWARTQESHFDASRYTEIAFSVKGDAPNGFQVGVKDTQEHEVKVELAQLMVLSESEWREIAIPLDRFATPEFKVDMANVRNINFGFNRDHGGGSICIDDIAFR